MQQLFKNSLYYQVNVTKAKKFKKCPFYSQGVGIEAYLDTTFIGLQSEDENRSRRFIFLVVVDTHFRMVYSLSIDGQVITAS